jgi:glutathione synthase/RimK-type ligase-like ATP-grasp enzyme
LNDAPYDTAGQETMRAAHKRGHQSKLFTRADEVYASGYVMARLHQWAPRIWDERMELMVLRNRDNLKFVQDETQLRVYEDKLAQAKLCAQWMPETHVYTDKETALQVAANARYPIISKSSIGSASHNVRVLRSEAEAHAEAQKAFGKGLTITKGIQLGYVYWQEFIPHTETWRVAIAGTKFHVYKRFNYDDRPVAAPSKVKPTQPVPMCPEVESLLAWANDLFAAIGTKWCAIDVLKTLDGSWKLLETSLAWARGKDAAGLATWYGTKYNLLTQHELLIEEMEKGVFG